MTNEEKVYSLKIAGRDYTIRSADAPEHVRRLAVYTDRKLTEILRSGFVSREDGAVIAALSLSEELLNAQDEITRLRRDLYFAMQAKNAASDTGADPK
ncbi:MAG: cell division protein ZapA [Clostridia bacterium]|nr:cell division protein ZapA [Clostridia bacterium]